MRAMALLPLAQPSKRWCPLPTTPGYSSLPFCAYLVITCPPPHPICPVRVHGTGPRSSRGMAGRDGAFARHPSGTEPMRQTVSARVCFLTAQSRRKRKMEAPTARGGAAVNLRCIMPMALSAQAGRPGPPPLRSLAAWRWCVCVWKSNRLADVCAASSTLVGVDAVTPAPLPSGRGRFSLLNRGGIGTRTAAQAHPDLRPPLPRAEGKRGAPSRCPSTNARMVPLPRQAGGGFQVAQD